MTTKQFAAVTAVRSAVRKLLAELELTPESVVLVGCSGGADSLALAAALAYESKRVARSTRSRGFAIRAGAVIVDHGLQANSEAVAHNAADNCRRLGLDPVKVRRVDVDRNGSGGLADAARAARYVAFEEVAEATGAEALLLAHTADDQAEQVLLALARGSGTRSLAGIPASRGIYERPLLGLRHAQLVEACREQGLVWWEDPTNHLTGPEAGLRARVRNELLPMIEDVLGPGVAMSLARTASLAFDDAEALDSLAAMVIDKAMLPDANPGCITLDPHVLACEHAAVRRRALRAAAVVAGAGPGDLRSVHLHALDDLVMNWRGERATFLPSGLAVRRNCDTLVFEPKE